MEIGNNVGIANFILGKLLICTGPVHGTFRALHALIGGGNWNNGVHDGSRAVNFIDIEAQAATSKDLHFK